MTGTSNGPKPRAIFLGVDWEVQHEDAHGLILTYDRDTLTISPQSLLEAGEPAPDEVSIAWWKNYFSSGMS